MSSKEKKGGLFRKIKGKKEEGGAKKADGVKKTKKAEDSSSDLSVSDDSKSKRGREGKGEDQPPVSPAKGGKKKGDDGGRGREGKEGKEGKSMFQRVRERSRSRSRSRKEKDGLSDSTRKDMLVAVTSCRSDGYYNQKAPGTISKLPRKAPTNLKLFHELAVGVKDAYAAVGETPQKPEENNGEMSREEHDARMALWEFIGNLDFLLALVDEVAVDTVTRGALKDDATFKGLRDVIKKCNRVLEDMLVRRERKYTLFFRLVQPHDSSDIGRMKAWNDKVEKAVGSVTGGRAAFETGTDDSESDTDSTASGSSDASGRSGGLISRGRQLLPTAGKVRSRRATPTPKMRRRRGQGDDSEGDASGSAEDGYSAVTAPLAPKQAQGSVALPNGLALKGNSSQRLADVNPMAPKDELVDVIRGLRVEKSQGHDGSIQSNLQDLKPNWLPKADIPSSVPKLPTEYVHRHRLMKQVVSCLLDQSGAGPRDTDEEVMNNTIITSVTSRHSDKAGNGKTTLAVAAIQTVEVRERFADGIAWLKLGAGPLSDKDIRRLYGELYKQLIVKSDTDDDDFSDDNSDSNSSREDGLGGGGGGGNGERLSWDEARRDHLVERADTMRRFQGGDLEGIKEDLGRMLPQRGSRDKDEDRNPYRILMTTRTPSLMGAGIVQEVFVRILSEHEAVKLLLSTAGRRPYGGRNSKVFNQARMIVKGCGNSPLAIRLVGSMLRLGNRNWNLKSPIWMSLINQCTLNLEEASILRSFVNAFTRIVDLSFFTVNDIKLRIALRRCFVWFAMAFRDNDWMLAGKGIPQSVVLSVFETVVNLDESETEDNWIEPETILSMLEKMNLLQRAGHGVTAKTTKKDDEKSVGSKDLDASAKSDGSDWSDMDEGSKARIQHNFVILDSLKAVAEKMACRQSFSFYPKDDQFTFFSDKIEEEIKSTKNKETPDWGAKLNFLSKAPNVEIIEEKDGEDPVAEEVAHELVIVSLLAAGDRDALDQDNVVEAMKTSQVAVQELVGGVKLEEYTMSFLPDHLMRSRAFSNAAELLACHPFVRRRVFALGIMEATSKEVADILELRRVVGKYVAATDSRRGHALGKQAAGKKVNEVDAESAINFDIDAVACDGSRLLIDEIYRVTNSMGSSDSLGMATCLAAVGEGLLKCRQPRDAMLRLEEAVSLYRGILGPFHVYVAHALHQVAKALVKLGETRVALLKFAEAARIYEACNATLHYDSIQNAQSLASLLVDIGDMDKAESMFEEVIAMKMSVYGEHSVPVAKTINSYAILLAKHGRMNQAMGNYEAARATYERAPPPLIYDAEFEIKCSYDVTLITLNIASIWSKKGDLQRALGCYEEGVVGLRKYDEAMLDLHEGKDSPDSGKSSSHKHMVAALGRIGSIKLKLGDEDGALDAYLHLLEEVSEDSPLPSHTEKAKAHIKCATIFRQKDDSDSRAKSVEHLREAFRMYKAIFGPGHKDTVAIKTSLDQWLAEEKKR
ncbi:tetratricopeptide repeat domain [Seminavis robusta]|uniref:Tetratricopeptide repeat domain n=1 Tax=Seminavis robusta TaxID=568900 RepID=A0A9N8DAY8_9STRA|nr:tetratricopeptide repeat domain [Seminavis robusta]|eukprot:Sro66_g037170.1 tetratricopeptide repeat domain (1481) ;mRNA; f:63978-68885